MSSTDVYRYLLTDRGMQASREIIVRRTKYFYHNTTLDGLKSIKNSALIPQGISAVNNIDTTSLKEKFSSLPKITCLWAKEWIVPNLAAEKKYRLRFSSEFLPTGVILDFSYEGCWSLADILANNYTSNEWNLILEECARRRGSLACYESINVANLDIQLAPEADPEKASFAPLTSFNLTTLAY